MPSIVADLASAYLLYRMLDKEKAAVQLAATAIYIFFPCALLVGAVWGQVDSVLAFFLLLTVYFIGREKPVAGAAAYTIGFLVKPQAIAALPFLAFWILRQHPIKFRSEGAPQVPRVLLECIVVPLVLTMILVTPFFELQPWKLIHQLYQATNVSNYRVNSFWAYNFWNTGGLFKMGFKCDLAGACPDSSGGTAAATKFLGMSTRFWSVAMLVTALVSLIILLRNARSTGYLALGTALSTLSFYLLLTRMHERYVFPFFCRSCWPVRRSRAAPSGQPSLQRRRSTC
jgi:Gpi18-like mannosyltransferase